MNTIFCKRANGRVLYYGYYSEQELNGELVKLSIPDIKFSEYVKTRDILACIRNDSLFVIPAQVKTRPNVKGKSNHFDLQATITPMSDYEMKKYNVRSSYYKV